jgi:predicted GNAT family acetyltransferase
MSDLRDVTAKRRYEQGFTDADGVVRCVWADYADRGEARAVLHVEAEPELRGTGASGRFMQSLADHARREGVMLIPVCGYAVAWFRRHPDQADVLA